MKKDPVEAQPQEALSSEPGPRTGPQGAPGILDELLTGTPPRGPTSVPLVGECIESSHPTLQRRVLIRWCNADGSSQEGWLSHLQGVLVSEGDRVLMQQPCNWPDPLVVGVLDGLEPRRQEARRAGPSIALGDDQSLLVHTEGGQELLEIRAGAQGPVVRLLHKDLDLELPGQLRIRADSIKLEAERGNVEVTASDDVVIQGEGINLN